MKVKIALVALMLVMIPFGMAMAQQPTNLYDTLAAAGNYKTFLSLVDKAHVDELKAMQGPFTVFAPTDAAFATVPKATMDKIMGDPAIVRDVVYFQWNSTTMRLSASLWRRILSKHNLLLKY